MSAATPDTCPRCGGSFACGMKTPGPCACTTLTLGDELLAHLRAQYAGCLCLACLQALAAAESTESAGGAVAATAKDGA